MTTKNPDPPDPDYGPYVATTSERVLRVMLGAYLIALNLICVVLLFMIWPGVKEMFPNVSINPPDEIRLLLLSGISGALGSATFLLLGFLEFDNLDATPKIWPNVARPITGMVVGLFVYIAIRGGILKVDSGVSVDVLNPYTVATIAILGGAFSKPIVFKLISIAERRLK